MRRVLVTTVLLLVPLLLHAQGLEELKRLAEEDQKDRQNWSALTREDMAAVAARDRVRRERVWEMIGEDLLADALDFDRASLILQHGDKTEEYEAARELSILAFARGRFNSMPALAEDRFLLAIGRPQRFGGQFRLSADGKVELAAKPDMRAPTAVTDALRLEFLQPPFATIEAEGSQAYQTAAPQIAKRLSERWTPEFLATAGAEPRSAELETMAKGARNSAARERVLALYNADELKTTNDYANAARILTTSSDPTERLLANELAALAAMRGHPEGGRLYAETWDRFLGGISRPTRYGTRGTNVPRRTVGPAVRRAFGLQRSAG